MEGVGCPHRDAGAREKSLDRNVETADINVRAA
jgi:hypothetical protein